MLASRIGVALEIFGTILLTSSLAGPERLERWEASLRGYLKVRRAIIYLHSRFRPIIPKAFGLLRAPMTILATILLIGVCVWGSWYLISGNAGRDIHATPEVAKTLNRQFRTDCLCGLGFMVFWTLLFGWSLIRTHTTGSLVELGSNLAKIVSYFLAILMYGVLFLPCLIAYVCSFIFLCPYLLAERISIRFQLRPALGVFGTMVVLVGLSVQLFA